MNDVKYLIGNENITVSPLPTFSEEVCNFLNDLSKAILQSPAGRLYPDLSALAFWSRKGNIQKIKEKYNQQEIRLGRGLCFHIAPSNIPINFAFSYLFSLLAGNANIVRLPSKDFPQVNELVSIMKSVFENYPEIEKRTAFVKYGRNNEITQSFSQKADARMIWGGDNTIATVRQMSTKPRCVDIAFADRYSVCIIDANKILEADEETMQRLGENFYNDTYLMDQNACSSPQLMYWLNDNDQAREKFWNIVLKTAQQKYDLQDAICVDKYTKLCEDAIDNTEFIKRTTNTGNLLYRIDLKKLPASVENLRGKGGYFYEYSLSDIEEFLKIVNEKYQTVTYFGIDAKKLADILLVHNIAGIDRIVPIGKAMDINIIWDGHDLLRELSRVISYS